MSQALDSMKQETEKMSKIHSDLSTQLYFAADRVTEFVNRQKVESKQVSPLILVMFADLIDLVIV